MMGRYPAQNQQFPNQPRDINSIPSYYNLSSQAQARFQEQHPKHWYESQVSYVKRLEDTFQSSYLHVLKDKPVYNANPTQGFFPQASSIQLGQQTYTSLDIETDDYGHPLSVIAHKFIQGPDGEFQSVGTYQRYYKTHGWDIRSTQAVHGFTPAALKALRKQQGATYGATYKGQEIKDLQSFLGDSVVIGHNIGEFDLPKLFPEGDFYNSTIDTLSAARNAWKGAKNSLDHVYYRIFGKTMEQDGLFHHDANADVIASMRIMAAMSKDKGHVGRAIRYIMGSEKGYHLTEYDEYMRSMVAKGAHYRSKIDRTHDNLHEVYMKAEDYGLMEYDEDGNKMWVGGFHEDKPLSIEELADEQLMKEAAQNAADWARDLRRKQGDRSLSKKGSDSTWLSNTVAEQDLFQEFNQFNNYKRLGLIQKIAAVKSEESLHALQVAAGYETKGAGWDALVDMASKVRSAKEQEELADALENARFGNIRSAARDLNEEEGWGSFDRGDATKKITYLDKMERRHMITGEQRANLDLIRSYEDVVDATEEVIEANKRMKDTLSSLAEIRPYDINQYVHSAEGQWAGIMGAARGVVPEFIRNPINRFKDAAFNEIHRQLAPWNAVQRTYQATLGTVLQGSVGTSNIGGVAAAAGRPGIGAFIGAVRAGEQVWGNYKQARMEMRGYDIQNNLNTLGGMIAWISTPFQLLHKALKLSIGSLSGFTYKLNNFLGGGISLMSQMGNPLTTLTGVNYNSYAGSTMMDIATLSSRGTANKAYEDYAYQQQAMYMGQFDLNRMIAASMLGVYDNVYGRGGNSQQSYTSMANKLLADLKSVEGNADAQARIMRFASQINGALPEQLQTARLLNLSDINVLNDPSRTRGVYWRPIDDTRRDIKGLTEAGRLRWTQYEYGAAKEQMGYSKMRLANKLWTAGGKQIYNSFNELVDAIASGDKTTAVQRATQIWETFTTKFKSAWDTLKETLHPGGEDSDMAKSFKAVGALLENVVLKGAAKIVTIWDQLMDRVIDKTQGVVSYLSTVRFKITRDKNGNIGFDISSLEDIKAQDEQKLYKETVGNLGQLGLTGPADGMEGLIALGKMIGVEGRGGSAGSAGYNPTVGDIRAKLAYMHDVQRINTLGISELGVGMETTGTDAASVDALLNLLVRWNTEGRGPLTKPAATWLTPMNYSTVYDKQAVYDQLGYMREYRQATGATENILQTTINNKIADNYARVDLYFRDTTGKKAMIGADSKGSTFTKDLYLLNQMMPKGLSLAVDRVKGN